MMDCSSSKLEALMSTLSTYCRQEMPQRISMIRSWNRTELHFQPCGRRSHRYRLTLYVNPKRCDSSSSIEMPKNPSFRSISIKYLHSGFTSYIFRQTSTWDVSPMLGKWELSLRKLLVKQKVPLGLCTGNSRLK